MEEQANKNLEKTVIMPVTKASNRRIAILCISLVMLIIILSVVFGPRHNSKTVFTINGTAYNQSYILPLASFPIKELSEPANDEYKLILNMLEYKTVANNLGITPSPDQINSEQASLDQQYQGDISLSSYKTWSGLVALDLAIQNELKTKYIDGDFGGYSYIFWFGNTVDVGPAYPTPNAGNQSIYNTDKTYALSQANYYYNQLKTNKMTPAQVYEAVKANTKLTIDSIINPSTNFGNDSSVSWPDQVYYQDVINYIRSQHKTELSGVRTGTISASNPTLMKPNAFYYIVNITRVGISSSSFQQSLNSLKIKYYGIN